MDKKVCITSNSRRSARLRAAKTSTEAKTCDDGDSSNATQQRRNLQDVNYVLPKRKLKCGEVHISCLPPEVLVHVFHLLKVPDWCRVAFVCAGWRNVIYQKSLWKNVTITISRWQADWNHDDLLLDSLLLRGIQKLKTFDDVVLREVSRLLPKLHCLSLSCYSVSHPTWSSRLLQQMINLTQLDTSNVNLMDESIELIANHLKKLVSLDLQDCCLLTNRSLKYIAMGLPELKRLNLYDCNRIDDVGMAYLSGFGLDHPPAKLPQLQYLNLRFCVGYTDLAFHHLSRGQPSIQQLNVSNFNLSDAAFQWLAAMRELRHLNISNTDITGSGLVALTKADSPITHLDMSDCKYLTNKALEHVGQLKQLTNLKIDACRLIRNSGLARLVKCGQSPIRSLSMRYSDKITDDSMLYVAHLRQLHELHFDVGDTGLAHLASVQSPVAVVSCRGDVTDEGLRHLIALPNLQVLNLSDCGSITCAGLKEFVANERVSLRELRLCTALSCCQSLEAGTLSCVARGLPALTSLRLDFDTVDDEEMAAAVRLAPRLQFLFVNGWNVIQVVRNARSHRSCKQLLRGRKLVVD